MTNGLTVTSYDTFDDLLDYMDGSAAVIGEMLLPILEPSTRRRAAARPWTSRWRAASPSAGATSRATSIAAACYLPQEDLRRYDADPWLRRVTPEWRALMAFEIRRTHEYFVAGDRIATELPGQLRPLRAHGARPARPDARPHRPGRRRRVHRAPERPAVAHGRDRGAPLATEKRRDPAVGSAAVDSATHAIEVAELEKRYGDTRAVDGVTLSIPAGEVFGLSGPTARARPRRSRSSRATARPTRARCGSSGSIPVATARACGPQIGVMLQSGGLYPGLKPLEALRLFASYYDDPDDPSACSIWWGSRTRCGTMVRRMSGGQQQRLSLALALVGRPSRWCSSTSRPRAWTRTPGRRRGR